MKPIILGKNLLSDDEILSFAMSEENFRLQTLERLQIQAMTSALLTASILVRLQRSSTPLSPSAPDNKPADTDRL